MAAAGSRRSIRRNRGTLGIRSTGSSGFQPAMVRAHSRACAKMQGMELRGRRVGIIGFGGIGREMARICAGIGMDVVVWNRSGVSDAGLRGVTLDELLATSDVVSLHLGLNEQTKGFLDAVRIASRKPGAILVNTARGAIID